MSCTVASARKAINGDKEGLIIHESLEGKDVDLFCEEQDFLDIITEDECTCVWYDSNRSKSEIDLEIYMAQNLTELPTLQSVFAPKNFPRAARRGPE